MAIITLTSDWNKHDYYAGMLKGRIMRMIPGAVIIDITHDIQPFHSLQGAFVLRNALSEFPEGTIHIFLINQGSTSGINPVVYKYRGQYIIAWQDPVLGLLFDEDPEANFQVSPEVFSGMIDRGVNGNGNNGNGSNGNGNGFSPAFPEMTLFPGIAKWLSANPDADLSQFKPVMPDPSPWQPVFQEGALTGRVIFIDSYSNAISNINRKLFDDICKGRRFEILVKSNHYKIDEISLSYGEAEAGDLIALFNSVGLLEIAMVQARVGDLLSLEQGSTIKINFYD